MGNGERPVDAMVREGINLGQGKARQRKVNLGPEAMKGSRIQWLYTTTCWE